MSTDDRATDYESRYAHDLDLLFRITARRNRLFGLWAAEQLEMSPDDGAAYARDAVRSIYASGGEDNVFAKVTADLRTAGLDVPDKEVRRVMLQLMIEAEKQVGSGSDEAM